MTVLNLRKVDDRVWRSGQPNGPDDWAHVSALGVGRVLKLNDANTGADRHYCEAIGIGFVFLEISDHDAQTVLPDLTVLERIDAVLDAGSVLVHCTEGVDRTGIAIARYRVRRCGWTKQAAYEEWVAYGSHGYRGLVEAWNAWTP